MGVAFCLLFLLWFSSGIGMMYWDYPLVSNTDRLAHAQELDATTIRLSPSDAYGQLGADDPPPIEARLAMFDGRPAYKFGSGADQLIVYADKGGMQSEFPPELTRRIAAAWSGHPANLARERDNVPIDQWTISEEFAALRPLRKYTWPTGEQVYVSTQNGEVVQYTTRGSRLGAYIGPIPHWLYFTPLRRNGPYWSELVIWASGLATVLTVIGIAVGLWVYSPTKRFRFRGEPSALPYTGWKRWHSTLGLIFGVIACTWAFSGMLSMDPFPAWQGEQRNLIRAHFEKALRGKTLNLQDFDSKPPRLALTEAGSGIVQLELSSFLGNPVYLGWTESNQTRIVPIHGPSILAFDLGEIAHALETAATPYSISQVRTVTQYEAYYVDRFRRLPLPVIYTQLNDPLRTGFYVDPRTARIVQDYNSLSRRNRWLYHGLHSFDLPFLYKHRPAWDVIVLFLMAGGLLLCATSLVLAWKVLQRKLGSSIRAAEKTVPAAP